MLVSDIWDVVSTDHSPSQNVLYTLEWVGFPHDVVIDSEDVVHVFYFAPLYWNN
jgi:hypothetical protein